MNQLSRRALLTSTSNLAVCLFLLLSGANCLAQNFPEGILQITSPADGTVVHPGQTVSVTVVPVPGNVFTSVTVGGQAFNLPAPLYSAPYQFSLIVPQNIAAGKYQIRAIGTRQGQTYGKSYPISLDVEAAAAITKIRLESAVMTLSNVGDVGTLNVYGTFVDGSAMNITRSTGTSYSSGDTTAVTVSSTGLVTAVGVGKYGVTPVIVSYGGQQVAVQVSTSNLAICATCPPFIYGLFPESAGVGTSVLVSGQNFGVSQGSSTVTFNGTPATPTNWAPKTIYVPVPSGATSGNVVVTVGGVASNGVAFTLASSTSSIRPVQHASKDAGTTSSASLAFPSNNTAGNWIGVCIRAGASGQTFTVTDSRGNTYHKAIQFNETTNGNTLGIFYAENIAGGANTVTVSDTTSTTLRFAILEYSGITVSGSLDGTEAAQGTGTSPSSGTTTTTADGDLLIGAILTGGSVATFTAGSGYTIEESVPAAPNTKLIAEDRTQTAAGTASANATLSVSTQWAAGLAAFKPGAPPAITSLNPTSGTPGTSVTITGSAFGSTQGDSTVTFNGTLVTPTIWSARSIVVPVPTGATTGNVVVKVAGVTSNGASFTVLSGGIHLVQHTSKDVATATSSSLAFASNNTAGNFIAVCIRAGRSGEAFTVTDYKGNSYRQAVQKDITVDAPNGNTLAIYYAENIAGGANTVTVSDTISGTLRFAILEYTGVATLNSLDVMASSQGTGLAPNSGIATTTANGDLLLGAIDTADAANFTAGTGFAAVERVPAEPNTKLMAEDEVQTTAKTISATGSIAASDPWGAVFAAFKAHP